MPDKKPKEPVEFKVVSNAGGRVNPTFEEKQDLWNFLLASWRGGLGQSGKFTMTETLAKELGVSGYYPGLFKFKREAAADYVNRVAMSPYTPLARMIVDEYVKYVTKDGPVRTKAEKFDDLINNADREGRSMDRFVRDALSLSMVMGEIAILVDQPTAEEEVVSQADAKAKDLRAYASIILPQNIVDWSLNSKGKYEWLIIETTNLVSSIDDDEAQTIKTRTYWDNEVWQRYQEDDSNDAQAKGEAEWKLVASGKHPCKETPVMRIVTNDIDQNALTPESWFFDLADLNRAYYNIDSLDFANLFYATFGILILPSEGGDDNEATVLSHAHALTENVDTNGITRYVQTTGAEGESFDRKLEALIIRLYMTAGLQYQTGKAVPQSGISKAWDFQRVNQFLAGLAKIAGSIEEGMSTIAACWDVLGNEGYEAAYPKNFSATELAETIEAVLGIQTIGFSSETGRKEILKHIYKETLPDVSQNIMDIIFEEIDESEEPVVEAFNDGRPDDDDDNNNDGTPVD